jgi:Ca2+-binding RTX toxin-like protein
MAILYGNNSNNYIEGTFSADVIYGRAGNDTLHGSLGNDTLFGEGGNDSLYGDHGNDFLWGGTGSDSFHFIPQGGNDVVKDFSLSDTVYLYGITLRDAANPTGQAVFLADRDLTGDGIPDARLSLSGGTTADIVQFTGFSSTQVATRINDSRSLEDYDWIY